MQSDDLGINKFQDIYTSNDEAWQNRSVDDALMKNNSLEDLLDYFLPPKLSHKFIKLEQKSSLCSIKNSFKQIKKYIRTDDLLLAREILHSGLYAKINQISSSYLRRRLLAKYVSYEEKIAKMIVKKKLDMVQKLYFEDKFSEAQFFLTSAKLDLNLLETLVINSGYEIFDFDYINMLVKYEYYRYLLTKKITDNTLG